MNGYWSDRRSTMSDDPTQLWTESESPADRGVGSETGPLTTVVLCTTGQTRELGRAISSILDQTYESLELIVVDNRPGIGNARETVAEFVDLRLRYVQEPAPGLSIARNTGIRNASGSVIAFTDDDCVADPDWIATIRHTFDQYPRIHCVTGRTVAIGDLSRWEQLFEEFGTFDRGDEPVIWRRTPDEFLLEYQPGDELPGTDGRHSSIYPYTGVFGSGNNMAFRAAVLADTGYFDEALGAGTPAGGGEDLDMFIRLVLSDRILAFEPAALVRHQHRTSGAALRAQIRTYGSGLSAMMTKQMISDRHGWKRVVRRIGPGVGHLIKPSSVKNSRKSDSYPLRLTLVEWYGVALGPWLYLRGRRAVRRRERHAGSAAGRRRSAARS
jgi:glycosyltransferase involved in cell wall biosynthesis